MNRWLLNHLPTWGIMLLLVVGAVLLALLMLRLVRRYLSDWGAGEQNEVATLSVEIIGAIYGIILAFIIVALWEGFNAADDNVVREATALSQVVRSADAFPPEPRHLVVSAVGEYVHLVTDEEWALMREGAASERASDALGRIYGALQQYEPKTETQKVFYQQAVSSVNDALANRRTRLGQIDASISGALQFMMYSGFLMIVGFMAVIGSGRQRTQTVLLVGVTAILAFNLVLATTLDYPFSGDVSVSPEPFRVGVLQQFFGP